MPSSNKEREKYVSVLAVGGCALLRFWRDVEFLERVKLFPFGCFESISFRFHFDFVECFKRNDEEQDCASVWRFQLRAHVKGSHFDCDWNLEDDSNLLKGVYEYGLGNWEAIKLDSSLKLQDKVIARMKFCVTEHELIGWFVGWLVSVALFMIWCKVSDFCFDCQSLCTSVQFFSIFRAFPKMHNW